MNYNLQASPSEAGKLVMYDPEGLELFQVKMGLILGSHCFLVKLDSGITPISLSSNRALLNLNDMKALLPPALGAGTEIIGEGYVTLEIRNNLRTLKVGSIPLVDMSTLPYPGSYAATIKIDDGTYDYYCSGYHQDATYAPAVKMAIGAIAEIL